MAQWIIGKYNNEFIKGPAGVPLSILRMMKNRGIGEDRFDDFLSEAPRETYDPFLFPGIKEAAEIILDYLDSGKNVCIYGDYDADGVTSTALLLCVFSRFSGKLSYHVPSRFVDGYGLNVKALEKINEKYKPDLLITVDCGSTSKNEVEFAKNLGMKVIVTDHHSMGHETTPDCLLLNPKSESCTYPFKDLSGCGVAFKLAQTIERICESRGDRRFQRSDLHSLLDLVAISTVADVVPLLGENRTMVKYGLKLINKRLRPGIAALLNVLGLDDKILDSDNVAYILAPNINALGRMGSAMLGVELLSGIMRSESEFFEMAQSMVENNRKRKAEQERTRKICLASMEAEECGKLFPVIYAPGGHEGVAGIVAGNLKEILYRPVFVLTDSTDGSLKGTGRCIPGLNLHSMMTNCQELFTRFGGHAGACGFSIEKNKLPVLRKRMQEIVSREISDNPDLFVEKLYIEKELSEEEISVAFAKQLNRLEPFGEANLRPLFALTRTEVYGIRSVGAEGRHLRFTAKKASYPPVNCILFSKAAEYRELLYSGEYLDICGEVGINEYGGTSRFQMIIKDIRRCEHAD